MEERIEEMQMEFARAFIYVATFYAVVLALLSFLGSKQGVVST
jgi:hypothetical protein